MRLFDDFIKVEAREERVAEKSNLEKVLYTEEEIIKQYENDKRFEQYKGKEHVAYQLLYTTVKEKLSDIKISPELLKGYIESRDNTEENNQTRIRGMYSAALLEIICTKTPEAHTVIDGEGKTFNYLFYYIHNVKNLTLTNITGNFILYDSGSYEGSATNITLQNITGDDTLFNVGSNHGSATNITLTNIKGNWTLYQVGGNNGSATNITLQHITGNDTLNNAGKNGSATHITLHNVKGDWTLANAGTYCGSVKNVTLQRIQGDYLLYNAGSDHGSTQNILEENELNEKQKNLLTQIQKIAKTIHTLPLEEQTKAHEEITRLQKEIFTGENT